MLWNRLELMINTVENGGVDLDPVRTWLDILTQTVQHVDGNAVGCLF